MFNTTSNTRMPGMMHGKSHIKRQLQYEWTNYEYMIKREVETVIKYKDKSITLELIPFLQSLKFKCMQICCQRTFDLTS